MPDLAKADAPVFCNFLFAHSQHEVRNMKSATLTLEAVARTDL